MQSNIGDPEIILIVNSQSVGHVETAETEFSSTDNSNLAVSCISTIYYKNSM